MGPERLRLKRKACSEGFLPAKRKKIDAKSPSSCTHLSSEGGNGPGKQRGPNNACALLKWSWKIFEKNFFPGIVALRLLCHRNRAKTNLRQPRRLPTLSVSRRVFSMVCFLWVLSLEFLLKRVSGEPLVVFSIFCSTVWSKVIFLASEGNEKSTEGRFNPGKKRRELDGGRDF